MKEWKKPVINRVKLDPSQAVLQACIENQGYGAWLTYGEGTFCAAALASGTASCALSPRGQGASTSPSTGSNENAGS